MGVWGAGGFCALEFLSLTCSSALCSSSFHSNCPPDEGPAFYSAGEMDGGGGGGESEVTGGVKGPRTGGGGGNAMRIC